MPSRRSLIRLGTARFHVEGVPAIFAVRHGKVVDFIVGVPPKSRIQSWLDRALQRGALAEAQRLEEASPADAKARYRDILPALIEKDRKGVTEKARQLMIDIFFRPARRFSADQHLLAEAVEEALLNRPSQRGSGLRFSTAAATRSCRWAHAQVWGRGEYQPL